MASLTLVFGYASAFSISVTINILMVIIYCHQDIWEMYSVGDGPKE